MKNKFLMTLIFSILAAVTSNACNDNICVGDLVYIRGHLYPSYIVGINQVQQRVTTKNSNSYDVNTFDLTQVAVTKGCNKSRTICVGDVIYARGHQFPSEVIGIFSDDGFYSKNSNSYETAKRFFHEISVCRKANGQQVCLWR